MRKSRAKHPHVSASREEAVPITVQAVNAAGQALPGIEGLKVRVISGKGQASITAQDSFRVWSDAKPRKGRKSTQTVYEISADVDIEASRFKLITGESK